MKFKILSIKDNSVRVHSGIVTFDVKVLTDDTGSCKIRLPREIFIADTNEWTELRNAVIAAYISSKTEDNSKYEEEKQNTLR